MRELDFINWICSQSVFDPTLVPVGPGDDCAVVQCGKERMLVTVDQVLDAVHFQLAEHGPEAAGRKAMARNLSDVAAMAALPVCAVASVAMPKGMPRKDAEAVYRGLRSVGDPFGCLLVGGDMGSWPGPLAISVTIIARPAGLEPVLRSGAKPGDVLCVTGALGGAWKTKRHLKFIPRIHEARLIASRYNPHAMIDISDGLGLDLSRICAASGVGADVFADQIPINADVQGADQAAKLASAISDGEDYELLMALGAKQAEELLADKSLPLPVRRIGAIVEGNELTLIQPDGKRERLAPKGWEHET